MTARPRHLLAVLAACAVVWLTVYTVVTVAGSGS